MNQDANGNRKLFWKEVSKANGKRWRIAAEKGMGESEMRRIWKEYF